MKRFLLLLMACATMFASCQKDADLAMGSDGGMVDVTISAAMEGASATTRAIADYGTGAKVDRCIMEVYCGDVLYKRMVSSAISELIDGKRDVTFELRLVASQTYNFLFWADASKGSTAEYADNYYSTENVDDAGEYLGLTGITASYDNYEGNDETRDAFFGNINGEYIDSSVALNVTLTRPFGQLNVLTALTDVPSDMYPKFVQISSSTPLADTFNVYSGGTSTSSDATGNNFKWSLSKAAIDGSVTDGLMHLSTDYIFAPNYDTDVKQQLVDFSMSFYTEENNETSLINTNDNFKNIPIQRNYRTNVSGELLTKQGTISVTIDPTFIESDITKEFTEVASVAELATLMESSEEIVKADASYVVAGVVEAEADSDSSSSNTATITIPDLTATGDTSRSIELKEGVADGVTLTITTATPDSDGNDPDVVYITIPTTDSDGTDITTNNLVINLPNSTVYINGVLYDPEVSTDEQTFIIQEGATVSGLTINKGNVEVHGTLKGYVKLGTGNTAATVTVYTATADVTEVTQSETTTDYGWAEGITVVSVDPSLPIQNVTSGISYSATQFQAAIDAAADGDVIELAAGEYSETNIKINKSLTIKGAQAGVSALSSTRDIDDTTNETVFTGNFSSVGATDKTVVVDGVYFLGGSQYTATETYNFKVVSTDKVEVTNCMAKDINRYLIYNNTTSSLINELVITNNKFFGDYDGSTASSGDDLLIYVNMVKSLTVTGNYLSSSSRGVNIAVTEVTSTHPGYNSETTQATITNNTFTNMKNYGVQTSYYPYGKIVINNNTFSDIDGGTDGEEEGAINIRGYQPADGTGELEYEYEITNNTFTNVASVFLPRLYSKNTGSPGLKIGDDKIVIKNNTISSFTNWILRCDDDKDYNGTIDLSDNDITYTGSFASYLYLLGDAKVLYGGVEYEYVFPAYNETKGEGYTSLSAAITAADSDDTIELAAGEFDEDITIDRSLTIKGAQAGVSGWTRGDVATIDVTTESHIKGKITISNDAALKVTLDGLYFDEDSNNVATGYSPTISVQSLDSITITNCLANSIKGSLIHGEDKYSYPKNVLIVTDNYVVGKSQEDNVSNDKTLLFLHYVKSGTITGNYIATASRGINITNTTATDYPGYTSTDTQLKIENNTFYDFYNYAIQTPYFPTGKIVINNNSFEKIWSQDDLNDDGTIKSDNSTEDGAINIRGYQTANQTNTLAYYYDITNNTFKDVQNTFFIRTYANYVDADNKGDSALNITNDDQVNISGNTITVNTTSGSDCETDWLFRCDKYGYTGTIDLSTNTITGFPSGKSFENYIYLTTDAKVTYGGETHPNNSIVSASELEAFALSVNAGNTYEGETITLDSDLDLSSIADWTPIGNGTRDGSGFSGNSFQGIFDGNNKTITKLQITSKTGDDAAGLFGVVSNGTVKNLVFEDVAINVPSSEIAAAAVGMLTGSSALVDNVDVKSGSVSAKRGNGAIVGRMTVSGTISNCENSATITGTGENVGGIVGAAYYTELDKAMYITDCYNYGTVTNSTAGVTGGIAGLSAAHVSGCENTAAITGSGYSIAGIVAEQKCYGSVNGCTNSGKITNNSTSSTAYGTGGIVGWVRYNEKGSSYARQAVIEVLSNNNSGDIDGGNDAGGIVGACYNYGIVNSNKNTAATISSSNFAAGIVGNAQFPDTSDATIYLLNNDNYIEVKNNVSTTPNITGVCTNTYVYDNSTGDYVTTDGNTNTIE